MAVGDVGHRAVQIFKLASVSMTSGFFRWCGEEDADSEGLRTVCLHRYLSPEERLGVVTSGTSYRSAPMFAESGDPLAELGRPPR